MAEKPAIRGADQAGRLRSCLAAWFAALLAIAPAAQPSVPLDVGAARAAASRLSILDDHRSSDAPQPAAGLQPGQAVGLGILSRLSRVETTFGPAPAKSPLHRPSAAAEPVLASAAVGAPKDAGRAVFDRSSVGTARTPTGPPS
jgi:hypothetical protein